MTQSNEKEDKSDRNSKNDFSSVERVDIADPTLKDSKTDQSRGLKLSRLPIDVKIPTLNLDFKE